MEGTYIGLICFWAVLILTIIVGFVLKQDDRRSFRPTQKGEGNIEVHNNSKLFPYLTINESDYFYSILVVMALGLVIYSSVLVADVV